MYVGWHGIELPAVAEFVENDLRHRFSPRGHVIDDVIEGDQLRLAVIEMVDEHPLHQILPRVGLKRVRRLVAQHAITQRAAGQAGELGGGVDEYVTWIVPLMLTGERSQSIGFAHSRPPAKKLDRASRAWIERGGPLPTRVLRT